MEELTQQQEKDLAILKALYLGNHLEPKELERAMKLVYLLDLEAKNRVK